MCSLTSPWLRECSVVRWAMLLMVTLDGTGGGMQPKKVEGEQKEAQSLAAGVLHSPRPHRLLQRPPHAA